MLTTVLFCESRKLRGKPNLSNLVLKEDDSGSFYQLILEEELLVQKYKFQKRGRKKLRGGLTVRYKLSVRALLQINFPSGPFLNSGKSPHKSQPFSDKIVSQNKKTFKRTNDYAPELEPPPSVRRASVSSRGPLASVGKGLKRGGKGDRKWPHAGGNAWAKHHGTGVGNTLHLTLANDSCVEFAIVVCTFAAAGNPTGRMSGAYFEKGCRLLHLK